MSAIMTFFQNSTYAWLAILCIVVLALVYVLANYSRIKKMEEGTVKVDLGEGPVPITIGVGIDCGSVVCGEMGSGKYRVEYTAIGDTVNTASRLESNAAPGTILISEAFMQALGPDYTTESIGEMTLKGKQLPIKVYHLLKGEK